MTALVTGAGRGSGRSIALALGAAGARVVIVDVNPDSAQRVADAITQAGGQARATVADVSNKLAVQTMLYEVLEVWERIDLLVNAAHVTPQSNALKLDEWEWNRTIDVNLKGAFHTTRAVIKGMMKRRAGRIINIKSVVGLTGNKGQANYAASKAGLIGFTKSVAKEYASRGVLANCIAPGFIDTDMTAALPGEARDALLSQIALGRLGQPADIAGAVLFLASDLARYVTGQVLVVDGGMVI